MLLAGSLLLIMKKLADVALLPFYCQNTLAVVFRIEDIGI